MESNRVGFLSVFPTTTHALTHYPWPTNDERHHSCSVSRSFALLFQCAIVSTYRSGFFFCGKRFFFFHYRPCWTKTSLSPSFPHYGGRLPIGFLDNFRGLFFFLFQFSLSLRTSWLRGLFPSFTFSSDQLFFVFPTYYLVCSSSAVLLTASCLSGAFGGCLFYLADVPPLFLVVESCSFLVPRT